MGGRLIFEAGAELVVGEEVEEKGGNEESDDAAEEMKIAHQDDVADAADGTEAGALGEEADDQAGTGGDGDGGVGGTGPFFAGEEGGLAGGAEGGVDEGQEQEHGHDDWHGPAGEFAGGMCATEAEAHFEELDADGDAGGEAEEAEDGVPVTAGESEDGAPGAAEEYEGADHGEDTEDEADDGGRAGAGAELAEYEGGAESAKAESGDFGAEELDDGGAMEAEGAGDVAGKTGDADAHIGGVAEVRKGAGDGTDGEADDDDADEGGEGIAWFWHGGSPAEGIFFWLGRRG